MPDRFEFRSQILIDKREIGRDRIFRNAPKRSRKVRGERRNISTTERRHITQVYLPVAKGRGVGRTGNMSSTISPHNNVSIIRLKISSNPIRISRFEKWLYVSCLGRRFKPHFKQTPKGVQHRTISRLDTISKRKAS